jgi:hypothetical protein
MHRGKLRRDAKEVCSRKEYILAKGTRYPLIIRGGTSQLLVFLRNAHKFNSTRSKTTAK